MDAAPTTWSTVSTRTCPKTGHHRLKRWPNARCPSSVTNVVSDFQKPPSFAASVALKGLRCENIVFRESLLSYCILIFELKKKIWPERYSLKVYILILWMKVYILIFLFQKRFSRDREYIFWREDTLEFGISKIFCKIESILKIFSDMAMHYTALSR